MRIRFSVFPSFYLGLTVAPKGGYVSLGLGFCSFVIDTWMDRIERGEWPYSQESAKSPKGGGKV